LTFMSFSPSLSQTSKTLSLCYYHFRGCQTRGIDSNDVILYERDEVVMIEREQKEGWKRREEEQDIGGGREKMQCCQKATRWTNIYG